MFVSIVIPTHNRRLWVLRAVTALLQQDYPADRYEVIICCDRCCDGTQEALLTTFADARLRVLEADEPGQTGALNTGWRRARGELLIFLDDEIEADRDLILAYVRAFQNHPGGRVAMVGDCRIPPESRFAPVQRGLARAYDAFFQELARAGHCMSPVDLCGCNFAVPRSALVEAGGFNQNYFFARNDFELAARLLQLGYQFRFCQEARGSLHLAETGDLMVRRASEWARADCRLSREHPWCVPHLAFYAGWHRLRTRLRWRLLWLVGDPVKILLAALRRLAPENRLLVNWEFDVRYCLALRAEFGRWNTLCEVCRIN